MGRSLKKKIARFLASSAITLSVGASGASALNNGILIYGGSGVVLTGGVVALVTTLGTSKAESGVNACASSFNPNLDINLESLPFHGCDTYEGYCEDGERYYYCNTFSKELKYGVLSEKSAFEHNAKVMGCRGYDPIQRGKLFACALIRLLQDKCDIWHSNVTNISDIVKCTGWVFDRYDLSEIKEDIEKKGLIDDFLCEFALKGSESGNWRDRAGGVAKFVYDVLNKEGEFDNFCQGFMN